MRSCWICGRMTSDEELKYASQSVRYNYVLMMALSVARHVNVEDARVKAGELGGSRKICHHHIIHAAQYLLAEMVMAGSKISHCDDPNAHGRTAYVTDGDIPPNVVYALNRSAEGRVTIAPRDVSSFINDAFRRYYGTEMWPLNEEMHIPEVEGDSRGVGQEAVAHESEQESVTDEEEEQSVVDEDEQESAGYSSEMVSEESETDDDSYSASASHGKPALRESDPIVMDKYFLVNGRLLLQLFQYCPQCGKKLSGAQLNAVGTAAIVKFVCEACSRTSSRVQRWESQERTVTHNKEKTYKGNVVAAVAAITTGLRYVELQHWAHEMNLAMFSNWFFNKVFNWTKPAIEDVYRNHQQFVLEMVRRGNGREQGLHLAADGAYDSRGYSALIGKVVLADTRTKLVLHTEVLHRSETGGVSGRMEVEGLRRLLRWVKSVGFRVESLTTDRSKAIGALLKKEEQEFGVIRQYYDGWHLTKWLGNELRKVSREKGCNLITMWIEHLKTHLWKSIEVGAQEGHSIRHIFNSCLMHVRDVHEWPQEEITGDYTMCGHGPLVGPRPSFLSSETKAYMRLRDVVLTQSFQRDLPMASPFGGTSICEAKNALDRIYCRKEVFYPISTYPLYTMMATMHINTLRLAELSGERNVVRITEVQRKYLLRKSKLIAKSPAEHLWRRKILEGVLVRRLAQLNNGMALDDNNNVDRNLEQEP